MPQDDHEPMNEPIEAKEESGMSEHHPDGHTTDDDTRGSVIEETEEETTDRTDQADDRAIERMAEKIRSSGRRRRPNGRWSNPASPLQAARFAARMSGKQVVAAIRGLCPGHGGEPCRIDVSKVSDYETRNRRPGVDHIEAFARLYQKSPEVLGLIKWRDESAAGPDSGAAAPADPEPRDGNAKRLVDAWLRESATSVATAVLTALARCPIDLNGKADPGQPARGQDDLPAQAAEPTTPPA